MPESFENGTSYTKVSWLSNLQHTKIDQRWLNPEYMPDEGGEFTRGYEDVIKEKIDFELLIPSMIDFTVAFATGNFRYQEYFIYLSKNVWDGFLNLPENICNSIIEVFKSISNIIRKLVGFNVKDHYLLGKEFGKLLLLLASLIPTVPVVKMLTYTGKFAKMKKGFSQINTPDFIKNKVFQDKMI